METLTTFFLRSRTCPPTGSQRPSSLWLILVKPVVKIFPSLVKMALMGLIPSCGANLSCKDKDRHQINTSKWKLRLRYFLWPICENKRPTWWPFPPPIILPNDDFDNCSVTIGINSIKFSSHRQNSANLSKVTESWGYLKAVRVTGYRIRSLEIGTVDRSCDWGPCELAEDQWRWSSWQVQMWMSQMQYSLTMKLSSVLVFKKIKVKVLHMPGPGLPRPSLIQVLTRLLRDIKRRWSPLP